MAYKLAFPLIAHASASSDNPRFLLDTACIHNGKAAGLEDGGSHPRGWLSTKEDTVASDGSDILGHIPYCPCMSLAYMI